MGNEWQIGLLIIVAAVVIGFISFKFSSNKTAFDKFSRAGIGLFCLVGVIIGFTFIIDDATSDIGDGHDYDYEPDEYYESDYDESDNTSGGHNVSFKESYQGKYGGNPCIYKTASQVQTCTERKDCYGGFNSSNRDPSKCSRCGHSYKYHPN